ncbi:MULTISPECIES: DUF7344 domain-containing protein [Salinibaculum]|uniref:DUF7344 domain-containing protein n=1 Tax=Salinibaculum TaxID=2732368 RepID=UPI0030CAC032
MSNHSPDSEHASQPAEGIASPALSDDRLYRALTSTLRRRTLYVLLVQGESTVSELATLLAGWEATAWKSMTSREDYEQIRTSLLHHHLPLLADVGLVSYDRASGAVTLEPVTPAVQDLISQSVETDRR